MGRNIAQVLNVLEVERDEDDAEELEMVADLHVDHLAVALTQIEEDGNHKYLDRIHQIQMIGSEAISNYSWKSHS